jgi:hypothetical protein
VPLWVGVTLYFAVFLLVLHFVDHAAAGKD